MYTSTHESTCLRVYLCTPPVNKTRSFRSVYSLELKSTSSGNDFVREILYVVKQLILEHGPITGIEDLARLRDVIGNQPNLNLRIGSVDRCPRFRRLQAKLLYARDELADNELEVFLVAFTGDIPCHQHFYSHIVLINKS